MLTEMTADAQVLLAEDAHRVLVPGRPDEYQCWAYCSNYYNGGVNTYFNLRTLPDKNECYCVSSS